MLGFRHGDLVVFALTYGPRAQWVQNVLAAGGCDFEARNGTVHLSDPRLFRDPDRRSAPRMAGWILGLLDVSDFIEMRVVPEETDAGQVTRHHAELDEPARVAAG